MAAFSGYLALGVVDPVTSAFTEISGAGGYARQGISLSPDAAGVFGIAGDIVFPVATGADWAVVDAYAVYDAPSGGNLLFWWGIGRTPPKFARLGKAWRVEAAKVKLTFPTGSSSHGSPVYLGVLFGGSPAGLLQDQAGSGGGIADAATNAQGVTAYTLQSGDKGKVVDLTNGSAITLNLPNSLPAGFNCGALQGGAGQVTPAAQSGATLRAPLGVSGSALSKTRTQYAQLSLYVRTNTSGANAEWVVGGDMV